MIEKIACVLLAVFMAMASVPTQAQSCNDNIPRSTPSDRFDPHGATVTDTQTGLMWATCSAGQNFNFLFGCTMGAAVSYNWSEALVYAENSTLGGYDDWRLPNIKELQSIVEWACFNPAINLDVFYDTPGESFWSASPRAFGSSDAWIVYFYGGISSSELRRQYSHVRLVRGGQ